MANQPCLNWGSPGAGPIIRNDQGAGAGAARDFINFEKNSTETFSVSSAGLPDPGGGDAKRSITVPVGDIVADSDLIEYGLVKFPGAVTITKISANVDTNSADGTTNKQTISIKRSNDDGEVVSFITNTANPGMNISTWEDMGAVTNEAQAAGEYLYVDFTKTASGIVLSGLSFQIEYTLTG